MEIDSLDNGPPRLRILVGRKGPWREKATGKFP
jgi:hypothetical protein